MQKRGVSEVITIVLIVLIAFAAVVIVYNLTTTFLRQKTNTIDIGTLSTEVGINENALYINYTENTTQLTVTRSADSANLSSLLIIVLGEDGNHNTKTKNYTILDYPRPLDTRTYVLNITGFVKIIRITVYPVDSNGKIGIASSYDARDYDERSPEVWAEGPRPEGESENGTIMLTSDSPVITAIILNGRNRSVSDIEPSGIGVRSIQVVFNKEVNFSKWEVVVQTVEFTNGTEIINQTLNTNVSGAGTNNMFIYFPTASVVDTWVKVKLIDRIVDFSGNVLDGEAKTPGSGRGYIFDKNLDLPTGNNVAGGDAVFYVGSLRGDFNGDGRITAADVDGFSSAWGNLSLDADFRGLAFNATIPDGKLTPSDIDGFTTIYQRGVALGIHLDALPGQQQSVVDRDRCPELSTTTKTLMGNMSSIASVKNKTFFKVEGDSARVNDFIVIYSPNGYTKMRVLQVLNIEGGGVNSKVEFGDMITDGTYYSITTGTSNRATFRIDNSLFYFLTDTSNTDSSKWTVQVTWGAGAGFGSVGSERDTFNCAQIVNSTCTSWSLKDYLIPSRVLVTNSSGTYTLSGYCDGNYVMQVYCPSANNVSGSVPAWDRHLCEYRCSENISGREPGMGVCVAICSESDGGESYNTRGWINSSANGYNEDYCYVGGGPAYYAKNFSGRGLKEFYCGSDGYIKEVNYEGCTNGCQDGACVNAKHLACENYRCVEVDGVGGDECRIASDCQTDPTPPRVFAYFTPPLNNSSWLIVNASDPESKLIYIGYWYRGPKNSYWYGWGNMYYNCTTGNFCYQNIKVTPVDGAGRYEFFVSAYNNQLLVTTVYPNVTF
jgi:hypothetical protein